MDITKKDHTKQTKCIVIYLKLHVCPSFNS